MTLGAELDAEVDVGPLTLEGMIGLKASLDGIAKTLRNIQKLETAYQFGSVKVQLRNTGTSDSNGDAFEIGLGGPSYGRLWQVNSLVVGGPLWTTSAQGSAIVVVSSAKSITPPLPDIVDQAGFLPAVAQYSTGQIIVRHPAHLRIVILGPSENTLYAAGGAATDMPDRREPIEVER